MSETKPPQNLLRYRCHTEVSAAKIVSVTRISWLKWELVLRGMARIVVSTWWVADNDVEAGDYYVITGDGEIVGMPRENFESEFPQF